MSFPSPPILAVVGTTNELIETGDGHVIQTPSSFKNWNQTKKLHSSLVMKPRDPGTVTSHVQCLMKMKGHSGYVIHPVSNSPLDPSVPVGSPKVQELILSLKGKRKGKTTLPAKQHSLREQSHRTAAHFRCQLQVVGLQVTDSFCLKVTNQRSPESHPWVPLTCYRVAHRTQGNPYLH